MNFIKNVGTLLLIIQNKKNILILKELLQTILKSLKQW